MTQPELIIANEFHLDILIGLVSEFCDIDQHPFDRQRVERSLNPLLKHDNYGMVFLVESGGITQSHAEPAFDGYAVVTWGYSLESGGREALIDEIYLQKRGEGLGAIVMTQIFDAMRERGISRMFLETETHNERARRFYSRQGFETDDSIWMSRDL